MSAKSSDMQDQPTEVPHYHGYRMRLRGRFRHWQAAWPFLKPGRIAVIRTWRLQANAAAAE
jgi:hypothetical protein